MYIYGGFLKWWYPTTMGFPTKNDHFGVFWGYHHLRKHPCIYNIYPLERDHVERKLIIFQPSVFRGYVTLWGVKHQILWWGIIPRCILTSPYVFALLFAVFSWLKQKLLGGWTKPSEKYARQIGSFPQGSGWKQELFEFATTQKNNVNVSELRIIGGLKQTVVAPQHLTPLGSDTHLIPTVSP